MRHHRLHVLRYENVDLAVTGKSVVVVYNVCPVVERGMIDIFLEDSSRSMTSHVRHYYVNLAADVEADGYVLSV